MSIPKIHLLDQIKQQTALLKQNLATFRQISNIKEHPQAQALANKVQAFAHSLDNPSCHLRFPL